jgi:MFS family permease
VSEVRTGAGRQLAATSVAVVLGLAPWFSATAVVPSMAAEWQLSGAESAWLTMAVQIGFVAGTLVSAAWMLSDRWSAQRLAGWSCAAAAVSTAAIAWWAHSGAAAIALRVATGAALAGVYPPAMKLVAGWWRNWRGLAIGTLIGALSLGSASPHMIRVLLPVGAWRALMVAAALSAALGAAVFLFAVRPGPFQAPSSPLDRHALGIVLRDRAVMLATAGYLGHMWELYAMWSWMLAFWTAAAATYALAPEVPAVIAFSAIAVGGLGCVIAGWMADRVGRTTVTIASMVISGSCAIVIGPASHGAALLLVAITMIWGLSVVADSAQFSACVTELVPGEYTGTALTLQTSLGFLLTMRRLPEAVRLAGGAR